jgi:hypothetical protein
MKESIPNSVWNESRRIIRVERPRENEFKSDGA